ncbi:tRNA-dihydrouridine synthase [Lancefieldella sp. Marseille-Q7238]|uniref:tRNA dihydrouridine synthase n=1 Tax=Lancefieldella sp. Marseille-Q7238 TaxID=3022127 RepID=UPI0024A8ED39|nr:tRNA-dihydrouridine synthase [Lancefieldella sp. Marseille-Q7238]
MSADVAEILKQEATSAGLTSHLAPFAQGVNLRERLARNPVLMAPMAGVSDGAYRLLARAGGAALAYSEMVSVAGIHFGGEKTWELVYPLVPEPDIAVQVFGSKPEQFREATAQITERLGSKLALIDINMACPVPKVVKKGEGSALLDSPKQAAELVRACLSETNVPVTVKIRRGRLQGEEQAPEFARAMEAAGAAAITVHGRFASQLYRGTADWGCVSRVVDAVSIPVIGSGDLMSAQDVACALTETGVSAVMVARGTYGNPWIFSQSTTLLEGKAIPQPTLFQRLSAFKLHVRLLDAAHIHIARARSLSAWYFRGMPHAAYWRGRSVRCESASDFIHLADELFFCVTHEINPEHEKYAGR